MPPHEQIQAQIFKDLKLDCVLVYWNFFIYVASHLISGLVMVTEVTHLTISLIYLLYVLTINFKLYYSF